MGNLLFEALGVGLTVIGSVGNALGYVLQKKGHLANIERNEIAEIEDDDPKSLVTNAIWLTGFIVCLLGSLITAAAFNFGPQSVLAPLSALVLVCNAIFAKTILNEPFTRNNLIGIILVILGSVMAVYFGPKGSDEEITLSYIETRWRDSIFLIFFITLTVLAVFDYILVKIYEKKNAESIEKTHTITIGANFIMFSWIGLAAYFGSVNVLFLKSFIIILGSFEASYLANYLLYVTIIGLITVNVCLEIFRQKAIKYFDASYVVPIFQVMLILGAALMGAVFFEEFDDLTTTQLILFVIAIFVTVYGVYVLAFEAGTIYKAMINKVRHKHKKQKEAELKKQMSYATKARQAFEHKSHRQSHLEFPVFVGIVSSLDHGRATVLHTMQAISRRKSRLGIEASLTFPERGKSHTIGTMEVLKEDEVFTPDTIKEAFEEDDEDKMGSPANLSPFPSTDIIKLENKKSSMESIIPVPRAESTAL